MSLNRIYIWLRHPGESLSQRVVHAGVWAFALRITSRLFGLARTIILARLLAPNDFGLYGIALLSLSALETFSQTGFDQALIQKKEDTKPYLDTAWTIQVIRGFILATLLVLGAPLIGSFFGEPRAVLLVRVLGGAVLLKGLRNIGIVYFKKELEFHKQFIYEFGGTFADLAVAIPAAFMLRSVWALVFGLLAGNLVRMVVSYFIHPYRPSFTFNNQQFKELFGFGKWILGSSILVFLLTQGDDIFVGKFLSVTALGFYHMAYRISNLPATEYSHLIATVMFPAYSKLQDNVPRLKETYLKVLQLTGFLSLPIAGLIFILAPDFTKIFLGEKWMPMVPAMQILALYGMLRAVGATTGAMFMAVGKPEISTRIKTAQLGLLSILIYPLTMRWGIMGASAAVTAYALVFNLYAVYKILIILQAHYKDVLKFLTLPLIGSSIMILGISGLKAYVLTNVSFLSLLLLTGCGILIYYITAWFSDRYFNYGIGQLFGEQFTNLFQNHGGG